MNNISIQYYKSPIGEMITGAFEDQLCLFDFKFRKMRKSVDQRLQKGLDAEYKEEDHPILQKTRMQFEEYFQGERKDFDLPLLTVGTDFQKNVWNELLQLPYGTTSTYLQLSKNLNNEKAIRAVASANGANAISVIIPCHRIIGSDGSLVGYAGGLPTKKKLLQLEQSNTPLPLFAPRD